MTIELERRFFAVNSTGKSEFDWFLRELRIPAEKTDDIDSITVNVDSVIEAWDAGYNVVKTV